MFPKMKKPYTFDLSLLLLQKKKDNVGNIDSLLISHFNNDYNLHYDLRTLCKTVTTCSNRRIFTVLTDNQCSLGCKSNLHLTMRKKLFKSFKYNSRMNI